MEVAWGACGRWRLIRHCHRAWASLPGAVLEDRNPLVSGGCGFIGLSPRACIPAGANSLDDPLSGVGPCRTRRPRDGRWPYTTGRRLRYCASSVECSGVPGVHERQCVIALRWPVSLGACDPQFLAQLAFLLLGPFDGGSETVWVEHVVGSQPFDEAVDVVVVADPRDHLVECLVALRWDEPLSPAHRVELVGQHLLGWVPKMGRGSRSLSTDSPRGWLWLIALDPCRASRPFRSDVLWGRPAVPCRI